MRLISLTTDFGTKDGYTGVMKAVILGIAPDARIIDISHHIAPQSVLQGGLTLLPHISYFPADSIHIAVVDPGVGTERRPLAGKIGDQYYVAPDNGLLSPMIERAKERDWPMAFVQLDKPEYWLSLVSNTFHARDIFSPVGAYLATGVPLSDVGSAIDDPVFIPLPRPEIGPGHVTGQIMSIDHFGNLSSNITRADLAHLSPSGGRRISVAGYTIDGIVSTFGSARPGDLVALWNSDGTLGISVVNGNAQEKTGTSVGDAVEVKG